MDPEEYYDSLDEDSNYGSLESLEESSESLSTSSRLRKITNCSKIPVRTIVQPFQKEVTTNLSEEDDTIPFYDQSLSKSDVELKKMFLKYDSNLDGLKHKQKRRFNKKTLVASLNGKLKSNSYLDMFYAKIGLEKLDLTNRATCTSLSPKSFVTCEDFEMASSVDFSDIECIYSSKNANNQEKLSLSLTSLDSKFYSVSQENFKLDPVNSDAKQTKKNYSKSRTIKISELGMLGPEIPMEKLELLKKRQEYGKKVSQKNKIKMMETKLLQNLEQEIKECKKIV